MRNLIVLLALLLTPTMEAHANVWHVAKDGSGDFTVIQQAVDASASGDTIMIGPGRYDDKFLWGNPPWQQYTRVLVTRADLTLIGAGADQTIVGDASPLDAYHDQDSGMVLHNLLGGRRIYLAGICFENCYAGLYLADVESAVVNNCVFKGNAKSINASLQGALSVTSCGFDSLTEVLVYASHIAAWGPGQVVIDNSDFNISALHRYAWEHVYCDGIALTRISDCNFDGGAIGILASGGSGTMEIEDCSFSYQHKSGIVHSMPYGSVHARNVAMKGQYKALHSTSAAPHWEISRLLVNDAFEYSFVFAHLGTGHVHDSQLAKGHRYVVLDAGAAASDEPVTFDMTNNWWGTADPDSIQAWIYDGNDQPTRPYYFIDWEPFRSEPVAVQKRNIGSVKALFR